MAIPALSPFTAFGTLLLALSARIQACTLTLPDPFAGITFETVIPISWENCTLPITMQLRNQSTSTGDTVLYTWTVSTNPISVLIWQPEYIYETLYFVGVDRDGGRGETPAYVVQPGQIVGDWLSVSTPALSRVSLISKSIASISSKFGSSLATSSGTVTTAATSRSTSYLPSNTSSPATSVPTSSTSPLGGGGSNHTAIIASSAIIGVVALVAFIALGYWKWKRRCPPPYTSSGGVKYTQPNSTGTLQCFQP